MHFDRRSFFKKTVYTTLGVLGAIQTKGLLISEAFAKRLDDGIKKMKYIAELKEPLKGQSKKHAAQVRKALAAHKEIVTDHASALPYCKFCKFWEEPQAGWGHCRYVAKKGNKKGQKAFKHAWCQMFKTEKDPKKLAINIKASV